MVALTQKRLGRNMVGLVMDGHIWALTYCFDVLLELETIDPMATVTNNSSADGD